MEQLNQRRHKNVVYLNQPTYKNNKKRANFQVSRKQLMQWVLGSIVVVVLVSSAWSLYQTVNAYQEQQISLQESKKEYQEAQKLHAQLIEESKLVSDSDYLGQIARRDYYYSKPGEVIFELGQTEQIENNNNE